MKLIWMSLLATIFVNGMKDNEEKSYTLDDMPSLTDSKNLKNEKKFEEGKLIKNGIEENYEFKNFDFSKVNLNEGKTNEGLQMRGQSYEDVFKQRSSKFIGVSWNKRDEKWQVKRWSKIEGKTVHNGHFKVDNEVMAAHASDDLARKLMKNGEEDHKLNFPKDETEVLTEKSEKRKTQPEQSTESNLSISKKIERFEKRMKNIEQTPRFGLFEKYLQCFESRLRIPPDAQYYYGTYFDQDLAHNAVLLVAREYLESLKRVRDGKTKSPATAVQLKQKCDEVFSKENEVIHFEKTITANQKNPNYGIEWSHRDEKFQVRLHIPRGAAHGYSHYEDIEQAQGEVSFLQKEYLESLRQIRDGNRSFPATKEELKQKLMEHYKETAKSQDQENKLSFNVGEEDGKIFVLLDLRTSPKKQEIITDVKKLATRSVQKSPSGCNDVPLLCSVFSDGEQERETYESSKLTDGNVFDSEEDSSTESRETSQLYKVNAIWLKVDETEYFNYNGWFKYMWRPEIFTVTETKLVDDRIRGYCKEHGGWVTLKYLDDGLECAEKYFHDRPESFEKYNECLKRKRREDESMGTVSQYWESYNVGTSLQNELQAVTKPWIDQNYETKNSVRDNFYSGGYSFANSIGYMSADKRESSNGSHPGGIRE